MSALKYLRCSIPRILATPVILICILCANVAKADSAAMEFFGLAAHFHRFTDYEAECDEVIASGVKWVRIGADWGSIETRRGEYNPTVLGKLDYIIDRLTSNGVNVVWILGYTAPWASTRPELAYPDVSRYAPVNWSDWENFVSFMTARYYGKITHWEVWNEPDHPGFWKGTVGEYATMLRLSASRIRAIDANNKVLLGGLAALNASSPAVFFDQLLSLGAASDFDIVNYHSYGTSADLLKRYDGIKAVIDRHRLQDRKIWITETGFSTAGNTGKEVNKADWLDQTYRIHLRPEIEKIFWHNYRNLVTGNMFEDNFGLLANDRTPLKAFYYYQAAGGAESSFALQKKFPAQTETYRTLTYVVAASGNGARVRDYAADGSSKRIPGYSYMYFKINDAWIFDANGGIDSRVYIDVTYYDTGRSPWYLQYDAEGDPIRSLAVTRTNTGRWITKTFTVEDAKFANRQDYGADFRLYAPLFADLIVSKVVVRREMNPGRAVLGTVNQFKMIENILDPNGPTPEQPYGAEGYSPVTTIGGRECRQISSNRNYLYFRVSDGLARVGNISVDIDIRFWDEGQDRLMVQYPATSGENYKNAFIQKTGTNAWRWARISLSDANFNNAINYTSDFRVSNAYDNSVECIDRVDVTVNGS